MPGQPAALGRANIAAEVMTGRCTRPMRELCFEVAFGQPVPALDAFENIKAFERPRNLCTVDPAQDGLSIEILTGADDRAVKMPIGVTVAAHFKNERLLEQGGILEPRKQGFWKIVHGFCVRTRL